MTPAAQFAKWGLGQFIFGVFLSLGIVGHYLAGASHPTGHKFMENITLWWACPWTLSVAAIQAGGLGMAALGCILLAALRDGAPRHGSHLRLALLLCNIALIGLFVTGYLGYFVVDAMWPAFYYTPVSEGKNVWLLAQAACIVVYIAGMLLAFNAARRSLDESGHALKGEL